MVERKAQVWRERAEKAEGRLATLEGHAKELAGHFGDHYPTRCSLGALNCMECGTRWPCEEAVKELQKRVVDPITEYEQYEAWGREGR